MIAVTCNNSLTNSTIFYLFSLKICQILKVISVRLRTGALYIEKDILRKHADAVNFKLTLDTCHLKPNKTKKYSYIKHCFKFLLWGTDTTNCVLNLLCFVSKLVSKDGSLTDRTFYKM